MFDRQNIPAIAERLTQVNSRITGLVWQDLQRIKFDCTEKPSSFTQSVLIIQGKQDIVEEKTALKEHKAFKNSKLVLMDRCIHYGWLDRPDVYFDEIEKFVRSKLTIYKTIEGCAVAQRDVDSDNVTSRNAPSHEKTSAYQLLMAGMPTDLVRDPLALG